MPDILHRVVIRSTAEEVYRALSTIEGLAGWWTRETRGDPSPGGAITFDFAGQASIRVLVAELRPQTRVEWEVTDGPDDWVGTRIRFDLADDAGFPAVLFSHSGWRAQTEFMHQCSTKWAVYLLSLKDLLEQGEGAPFPDDVRISVSAD